MSLSTWDGTIPCMQKMEKDVRTFHKDMMAIHMSIRRLLKNLNKLVRL